MNKVESHGYGRAEIFFLAGYPLAADLNTGLALSGSAENTLNSMLSPYKLTLKNCYRSLLIKEKLTYSATNTKKLKAAVGAVNTQAYEYELLQELKEVQPNIIVPLDDVALGAVYPYIHSISKPRGRKHWVYCFRGSELPLRSDWQKEFDYPVRVIPTIGPQLLYSDNAARSYVTLDYKKIVESKDVRREVKEYGVRWVCKDAYKLIKFIERSIVDAKFLAFDIETYGGLITCISFSFDGYEGVSIPLYDSKIPKAEMALIWQTVAKLLNHPIPKTNQNIKYDWIILNRYGFNVRNVFGDTMLLGHCLYPELPKGLDFYTSIYTPIGYYKDEGKEFNPKAHTRDRLYLYNAMDSIAAHKVYSEQLAELEEPENENLKKLYHEEIVPLIPIYKRIDEIGIRRDDEQKERLLSKYTDLYESNLKTLRTLVNDPDFNPSSSQQVGILVYEQLGFPIRRKTDIETGRKSYKTDKDTLDDLVINHGMENKQGVLGLKVIGRVIICRKLRKVLEYINTPLHPDGRLRGSSNLAGTETGRSSFSKTIDEILVREGKGFKAKKLGRSLQTISKHGFHVDEELFDDFEDVSIASDLRSMFVPSPGYVFLEADGSQAEARHVAVLAEDWELLESFDRKPKVHAKTAGAIFGIDPKIITKDSPTVPKIGIAYYDLGKRIRHAGNYNMGPGRLAQMTHMSFPECKRMMEKFHEVNPNIRSVFHLGVIDAIKRSRVLVTPFGRKRMFFGYLDESLYKEAIAHIPQSTVSDHTKFTIRRVLDETPWVRFLAEQHDGLLMEVPRERVMEAARVVKRHLERPLRYDLCTLYRDVELVVPCETAWSDTNWMEMKDLIL